MNLTSDQKNVLLEAVSDYAEIYENVPKLAARVKAAKEVVAIVRMATTSSDACPDTFAPLGLSAGAGGNVASLKTELAAALADLIEYRRMRYADSAAEEARFRELTGHQYDDEE